MRWIRRRRIVLVTGSTGFLGHHLLRHPTTQGWEVIAPSSRSMDIRRRDRTIDTIRDWKPNIVVHLAYRKGDRASIVDGSANVAEGAASVGARLVHMSSDVVFPGRLAPYTERDDVRPVTDYGVDKADAEAAVAAVDPGAAIVRTSLLYGTERLGHVQEQLRELSRTPAGRRSVTWFTDEIRCPAHADDVAAAVATLAADPSVSGPLHVAGPESIDRASFARMILRHLGVRDAHDITTGTIAESGLTRPGRVVLDVSEAAGLGITCRPVSAVLG